MNKNGPMTLIFFFLSLILFFHTQHWFSLWLIMEMNTLTFMSLYFLEGVKSENMILYFLVQSVASFCILFSTLWGEKVSFMISLNLMMLLSILMKIGMAPLHSWIMPIVSTSKKSMLFIFLVLQKIIPLLWLLITKNLMVSILLGASLLNIMLISPQNLLQMSINFIVGFSSMSHLSWLILSISEFLLWEFYFIIYATMMFMVIAFLNQESMKNISQKKKNFEIFIIMMMLGGIPPLMGFFPKLLIFNAFLLMKNFLFLATLILLSLIDLFIYTRLSLISTLNSKNKNKWMKSPPTSSKILTLNVFILSMLWI